MSIPAWCAPYIGMPFAEKGRGRDGMDCWGFAQMVLAERFGITGLPDYVDSYTSPFDKLSVAGAIAAGLAEGWDRIAVPQPGALVIILLGAKPWHCGVMADEQWMLHMVRGANSVAERIQSRIWTGRIDGYYTWTEKPVTPASSCCESVCAEALDQGESKQDERCPLRQRQALLDQPTRARSSRSPRRAQLCMQAAQRMRSHLPYSCGSLADS